MKMHIEDMPAVIDLGSDHTLRFMANEQGYVVGGIMQHRAKSDRMVGLRCLVPMGQMCSGAIWLRVPELTGQIAAHPGHYETWAVDSWNPISLQPSLLCDCGDHGKVIDGIWKPC